MAKHLLVSFCLMSLFMASQAQTYEYKVEEALNTLSYYYTEDYNILRLPCKKITIHVVTEQSRGVRTKIRLGTEETGFCEVFTDSLGFATVDKKTFPSGDFHIVAFRNGIWNGIDGWINVERVHKLTIILGKQSPFYVLITSDKPLSAPDIHQIIDKLKKGEELPENSGIDITVQFDM